MILVTTAVLALVVASPVSRPAPAAGPDVPPIFVRSWGCEGEPHPFFGFCVADPGPGEFSLPAGAAVAPDGSVYVIDQWEAVVEKYSADGEFLLSWPEGPLSIAVGPDGSVYTARAWGEWAHKRAPDGTLLLELTLPEGQTFHPGVMDVAPNGEIYVGDLGSVRVFDPAGVYLRSIGDFLYNTPTAIAVGPQDDLFVNVGHLMHFSADGTLVQEWLGRSPWAIELTADGLLYESMGDRIEVSRMGGTPVFQWSIPGKDPFAADVDVAGNVVWVTSGLDGHLQKWGWGTVVDTDPPGLELRVDEVPYGGAALFDWPPGEVHRVSVQSPPPIGLLTKHEFQHWSDGGAQTHLITATGGNARLTARFDTSHWLEIGAAPGIRVRPASGWVPEGKPVPIEADPGDPFLSIQWIGTGDGSYSGPGRTETVTAREPLTQFAALGTSPTILFDFTISASDVDPFANAAAPTGGSRPLYLWATCALGGLAAFETGVTGSLVPGAFQPLGGVLDLGSNGDLLIAVPGCPTGPAANRLLGYWMVDDTGGTLCLGPSVTNNRIVAVECGRGAVGSRAPGVRGFSSSAAAPCETGWGCTLGQTGRQAETAALVPVPGAPSEVRLAPVGPNPFRTAATFSLTLPDARRVRVAVYDVRGRRVRELVSGVLPAGSHSVSWDGGTSGGGRAADGVYFVRLDAGDAARTAKVVLTRDR